MARKSKGGRRSTRRRNQRGGDGYAAYTFNGPAGISAGGVPFDSRAASNYNCGWDLRHAPTVREVGPMRGGGSCGCDSPRRQSGGGGGSGGHGFIFNNELTGKLYPETMVYPCPATPVATNLGTTPLYQQGGEASYKDAAEIVSYPSGWGVGPAGVVSTDSAHYVDPIRYGRHCMGGARRTKRKNSHKKMTRRRGRQ